MLIATALVNLSGAPAKTVVKWGIVVWLVSVIGDHLIAIVHELKGTTTLANIQINMGAALSVDTQAGKFRMANAM